MCLTAALRHVQVGPEHLRHYWHYRSFHNDAKKLCASRNGWAALASRPGGPPAQIQTISKWAVTLARRAVAADVAAAELQRVDLGSVPKAFKRHPASGGGPEGPPMNP